MVECPKCGGEMREGEAIIRVLTSGPAPFSDPGIASTLGMNTPSSQTEVDEKIQWQEKTGRKTGLFLKRNEIKTLNVVGQRCVKCGYIEFYAKENSSI